MTFGAIFSGFFAPPASAEPPTEEEIAFRRLFFGLQQPTDRDAQRLAELAIDLLDRGHVSEAAPLIEARFAAASDHVAPDGPSLKSRLAEALAQLKPTQRRRLQSVLRASFERRLADAQTPADWRRLVAASPADLYGPQALAGLARAEEDAGAYHAAARAYTAALAAAQTVGDDDLARRLADRGAKNRLRFEEGDPAYPGLAAPPRPDRLPASWCGAGGDARRRGVVDTTPPRRWREWSVSLPDRSDDEEPDETPAGFACGSTVAVAGVLVTRTPGGLVAIDAQSGKRVWRRDLFSPLDEDLVAVERGLSSDGRRVYAVVADPSAARPETTGRASRFQEAEGRGNALVAFDLPRQGRIAWRVDGETDGGRLKGVRFLGAPIADEGRLYALADLRQSIFLLEIDAHSGQVAWLQPLVGRPNGRGAEAAVSPVSPTLGESLLFCPTGAGAVVAVDPLRRRLVWTHYLSIKRSTARRAQARGWRGGGWNNASDAWRHARVIEHDGLLTIVSPAAPVLETLDAATGESRWSQRHKQGLLLAAVADGLVIVVDQERLIARDQDTGKRVWTADLPDDDRVSGEGILIGGRYLAPLASGQLLSVDIRPDSQIAACELSAFDLNPLEDASTLGGLIGYQGAIYSRSAESLDRLRPGGPAQNDFDRALDALAVGSADRAYELLVRGLEADPTDPALTEALAAATLLREGGSRDPRPYASGRRAAAHGELSQLAVALQKGDAAGGMAVVERLRQAPEGRTILTPKSGWRVAADRLASGRFRTAAAENGWPIDQPASPKEERQTNRASERDTAWSLRQIETRLTKKARGEAARRSSLNRQRGLSKSLAPLAVRQPASASGPIAWRLEAPRQGAPTLIGLDRWGDLAFAQTLPAGLRPVPRPPSLAGDQRPLLIRWGDWLALPADGMTAVYDLALGSLAWTTDAGDREDIETPVAIGPWGVITKSNQRLRCRRLLGGEIAWERDFAQGRALYPRVLAMGNELFVATSQRTGLRVSAWSGEASLADWRPPRALVWGSRSDENFYTIAQRSGPNGAGLRDLLVLRVDRPQDPLLRVEVKTGAFLTPVQGDPSLLAILTDDLELSVVDVRTAKTRFQSQLTGAGKAPFRSLKAWKHGDHLLIGVDRSRPAEDRREGLSAVESAPLLTGELHRLHAETGQPAWAQPARLRAMSLLPPQDSCPLLLLSRRKSPDSGADRAEATLSLVALDPATGASVYRNHSLPAGDESRGARPVRIQREPGGTDRLMVRLGRVAVTLTPTGPPAPPRPTYLAAVEDPLAADSGPSERLDPDTGRFLQRLLGD